VVEPDIAVSPKALFRKSSTGFARLEPAEACLVIEVAVSSLAYDMTETSSATVRSKTRSCSSQAATPRTSLLRLRKDWPPRIASAHGRSRFAGER
jgi:hypothetical protein